MSMRKTSTFENANIGAAPYSRRAVVAAASAAAGLALARVSARAAIVRTDVAALAPYGNGTLPAGIRSRNVDNGNGLSVHMLEAGFESPGRPASAAPARISGALLQLAQGDAAAGRGRDITSSRRTSAATAAPPDGTTPTTADLTPFGILNLVRDAVGLLSAFGYRSVPAVIGHDAGSPVASWCAVMRPDVFRSVVMMSSPFTGPPALPFDTANRLQPASLAKLDRRQHRHQLAKLEPPRKYYQTYYTNPGANEDMLARAAGPA